MEPAETPEGDADEPPVAGLAACPECGDDGLVWEAVVHGDRAIRDGLGWIAVDFDLCAVQAELQLTCEECGWSEHLAAGDWEAR